MSGARALRPISADGFAPIYERPEPGFPPRLEWVAIASLVVDPAYQREITRQGVSNIRRIAQSFFWAHFAPLIVTPIADGRFSIIDGQHRTTAAALLGYDRAPAMIVDLDSAGQAKAFAAVNGNVTRMHPLQTYAAEVAAGEPEAVAIYEATAAGGCRLLHFPRPVSKMMVGDSCSLTSIRHVLKSHGRDMLVAALRCITATRHNVPGALNGGVIRAFAEALAQRPDWLARGVALEAKVDRFDLPRHAAGCAKSAGRALFVQKLLRHLDALAPGGGR